MLDVVPWRPVRAVAWDSLLSVLSRVPGSHFLLSLLRRQHRRAGVPVFIMLPLDVATPTPSMLLPSFESSLTHLARIGATGVMADVWWGICEPSPGAYSFARYVSLFRLCKEKGLKVQATLSFHACGGNVGDAVNIPLPGWVVATGDELGLWFTDRQGDVNKEYLSFGADHEAVLPGAPVKSGGTVGRGGTKTEATAANRTPVQAYRAFTAAFVEEMRKERLLGTTVTELQVGLGPCGELRYPSYPLGKWEFPGIGEFQCFDRYMLEDMKSAVHERGSDEVKKAEMPPKGAGAYNDWPQDTEFFRKGYKTEAGRFFLDWYCRRMLRHGDDVLKAVREVVVGQEDIALAVKVSGVHWWKFSPSRAAEATSGYVLGPARTAYGEIAKLLKKYDAVFDFTCLEMRSIDQPWLKARCGPKQLVGEVFELARKVGVKVAGENALERYDEGGYRQVVKAFRRCRAERYGFTLLRLGDTLMEEENLNRLEKFVRDMKEVE